MKAACKRLNDATPRGSSKIIQPIIEENMAVIEEYRANEESRERGSSAGSDDSMAGNTAFYRPQDGTLQVGGKKNLGSLRVGDTLELKQGTFLDCLVIVFIHLYRTVGDAGNKWRCAEERRVVYEVFPVSVGEFRGDNTSDCEGDGGADEEDAGFTDAVPQRPQGLAKGVRAAEEGTCCCSVQGIDL